MARRIFVVTVFGAAIVCLCSLSSADVPRMINYQGKLTTASGGCLNDTVQMTFTIYSDSLGTSSDWTETQTEVIIREGVFSVLMGSVDSIPPSVFDGSIKYLGIQVESDPEMSPLKPMVSVGYAFRSAESDTAAFALSGAPDDDWDLDTAGVNVYRLTGNVGIGTPSPQYKMDIRGTTGIDVGTNFGDVPLTINVPSDQSALISRIAKGGSIINVVDNEGNVGIGTFSPQEKLDVVGMAQVTGFKMPTDASNGYVLTSDGFGVGTWQPEGSGPSSGWVDDGTVVRLETSTDSVGIGTVSPGANLEILDANPSLRLRASSGSPVFTLDKSAGGYWGYLEFREAGASKWQAGVSSTNDFYILNWPASQYTYYANSSGYVGIGTTSPTQRLDVAGTARMTGFRMPTGAVNGYVLTSDAGGVGTWEPIAASGIDGSGTADYISKFTASSTLGNSVMYENGGNIGIGTTAPSSHLDIVASNSSLRLRASSGYPVLTLDKPSGGTWGYLEFREAGSSKWQAGVSTTNDFYILNWPSSQYTYYANSSGYVGIGTTSPTQRLDVAGTARMTGFRMPTGAADGYVLTSDAGGVGTWQAVPASGIDGSGTANYMTKFTGSTTVGNSAMYESGGNFGIGTTSPGAHLDILASNPNLRLKSSTGTPVITLDKASGGYWGYLEFREAGASKWQTGITTSNDFYILNWPSSQYTYYANSSGYVGIGTTSPTQRLDVAGTARMTGFSMPTGSANGYVLTSDASGVGTWQPAAAGGIDGSGTANYIPKFSSSTTLGNSVMYESGGNIGIGTTAPGTNLDIITSNPTLRLKSATGTPVITLDKPSGGYWGYLEFRENGASKWQAGVSSSNDFYILNWPASQYVLYASAAGNLGVGTTSPAYKLDVNGDVNVSGSYNVKKGGVNYNHPDYVFEPDYELMSLGELRKYIQENKSLPNVISAEHVKKNDGFKMDELLIQMLEKIEEQTLYIFQLEERIAELEKQR